MTNFAILEKHLGRDGTEAVRSLAAGACYGALLIAAGGGIVAGADAMAKSAAPALSEAFFPDRMPKFAPSGLVMREASGGAIVAHLENDATNVR